MYRLFVAQDQSITCPVCNVSSLLTTYYVSTNRVVLKCPSCGYTKYEELLDETGQTTSDYSWDRDGLK